MENLDKKMNKYQEILTVLCGQDEDIDHAILITAHKAGNNGEKYDTTVSTFRCDIETAKHIMEQARERLKLADAETELNGRLQ